MARVFTQRFRNEEHLWRSASPGPLSALLSCVFSDARHVAHRSSTVFFDEELSPAQLTSIGKSFRLVPFALTDCQKSDNHSESVRICDRAALFLDIFS